MRNRLIRRRPSHASDRQRSVSALNDRRRLGLWFECLEQRFAMAVTPLTPLPANDDYSVLEDQSLTGNVIAGTAEGGADVSGADTPLIIVEVNGGRVVGTSIEL